MLKQVDGKGYFEFKDFQSIIIYAGQMRQPRHHQAVPFLSLYLLQIVTIYPELLLNKMRL